MRLALRRLLPRHDGGPIGADRDPALLALVMTSIGIASGLALVQDGARGPKKLLNRLKLLSAHKKHGQVRKLKGFLWCYLVSASCECKR